MNQIFVSTGTLYLLIVWAIGESENKKKIGCINPYQWMKDPDLTGSPRGPGSKVDAGDQRGS